MRPLEPLGLEGKVLPFRRPSAAVRVRRRNPWLRLGGAAARALLVVGAPAALALWLLAGPTFALSGVDVVGAHRVEVAGVRAAVAPYVGENLIRLPLERVEARVLEDPWIASARIEKRLPDRLLVELVEREPAALLRSGDGLVLLDRGGRPIAPWRAGSDAGDFVLISVGATRAVDLEGALAVADELGRVAPRWAASLSEVVALSEDDFRLYLGALPFPIVVRGGTLAERLPALAALLPELERRYRGIDQVDLRIPRRIVFQPLVERS